MEAHTGESERKEQEKWDAAYLLQILFSVVLIKKKNILESALIKNATIKYLLLLITEMGPCP